MSDHLNGTCPPEEDLAAYIEGRLTKEEHTSITEHLGSCSVCYRIFAEVAKEETADRKKRRRFYYRGIAAVAAVAIVGIFTARLIMDRSIPAPIQHSPDTSAYWVQKYGIADESELTMRAKNVFQRVALVTEKSSSREPQLLLVGTGDQFAVALSDANVVVSSDALRACYRNVTPEEGDARLAFVLGHEFAHLKKQQFTHAAAFSAVERKSPPNVSRDKELDADAYGLVYATMAGYDPQIIFMREPDFISEWTSLIPQRLAYEDREHPGPAERARFLRSHLEKVANDLDFFYFGVRLYQLGRYEDAILMLSRFADQFPSRETSNNLGLSHYQLAVRNLASCDPQLLRQAYPATILDTETLAGQFRSSGSSCFENKFFQEHILQAESYFRKAIQSDPAYTPAHVNLSSVQITLQQYSEAGITLSSLNSTDPAVLNNRSLALYLSDPSQIGTALSQLQKLGLDFAPAVYNQAVLQKKIGQISDAYRNWAHFLKLESHGMYADASRKELKLQEPDDSFAKLQSPIPLGDLNLKQLNAFGNFEEHPFSLPELKGSFYINDKIKLLVLEDTLEIVEAGPSASTSVTEKGYGVPRRKLKTTSGAIEVFGNFALDMRDGRIYRMVYFE
jgi:tetratricopeptide (TPR) repeat protein